MLSAYLPKARAAFAECFPKLHTQFKGCDEARLLSLSESIGTTIPDSYLELLRWMGEEHAGFWDHFLDDCLGDSETLESINVWARDWLTELSNELGRDMTLPPTALVIYWSGGGYFRFIQTDAGPDPSVYWFVNPEIIDWYRDSAHKGQEDGYFDCLIDPERFDGTFARECDSVDDLITANVRRQRKWRKERHLEDER